MKNHDLNYTSEAQLREQINVLREQLAESESKRRRAEKEADQLRLEVAQKADEIKQMTDVVETITINRFETALKLEEEIKKLYKDFRQQYEEDSILFFFLDLVTGLLQSLAELYDQAVLVGREDQNYETLSFSERLFYLRKADEDVQFLYAHWFLVNSTNLISDNPAAVCRQVILECQVYDAPGMDTLQRLKPWLDTHLPEHKLDTVCQGLKLVQAERKSGQSQKQFAYENDLDERTLRKYRKWWDIIYEKGLTLPDELKALFESITNAKK